MKSKSLFGLVALLVVLAAAQSSFAQVTVALSSSSPSQNEVFTARDAQAFDPTSAGAGLTVSGVVQASQFVSTTSLIIDYPGAAFTASGNCAYRTDSGAFPAGNLMTITTDTSKCPLTPAGDPLRIEGVTGIFAGVTISSINFSNGQVELTLPGGYIPTTPGSGTFRLLGARVDATGMTAPASVTATLSNSANGYQLGTNTQPVILALTAGMTAPAIGTRSSSTASSGNGVVIFTNRTVPTSPTNGVSFVIAEGFESAWRTKFQETTQTQSGASVTDISNGTQIRLTFTGLQSGMTLTLTSSTPSSLAVTLSRTSITSDNNTTVIEVVGSDLVTKETLQINGVMSTPSSSGSAFTTGPIQVTATLFPNGPALADNKQPYKGTYPNFTQADLGPLTIGSVVAPTTVLLIPYAVVDLGFDTGIAISNTTADPFGGSVNGGATAGSGPVTVSLYGRTATGATPTVVTINTSATVRPGAGLDASGNLNSGSTWTVLLSELRTSAGQTGAFTGYIFIQVPFLDGHGASFISDFRAFTSASPVMVLPPVNAGASRSNPANGVESLNN